MLHALRDLSFEDVVDFKDNGYEFISIYEHIELLFNVLLYKYVTVLNYVNETNIHWCLNFKERTISQTATKMVILSYYMEVKLYMSCSKTTVSSQRCVTDPGQR